VVEESAQKLKGAARESQRHAHKVKTFADAQPTRRAGLARSLVHGAALLPEFCSPRGVGVATSLKKISAAAVERDKLDAMSQNRLDFSISNVEEEIIKVENEIIKVENEIKEVEDKREKESDSGEKAFLRKEKEQLRKKEEQLRKKEEQLRKEKEQLRTKEGQLRQESRLTLESSPKIFVALTPPHTLSLSLSL
jgi:DNA repair exonuclease SbcCD ATPase subunit